eukprot:TRINITY_DN13316_c0_g1_i1.p1 TRINITY_DN13316_c0_g1~~TRINITY_DN13316_c0_g1_i1.p1  ORF type:complete len:615 (+),score=264.68 TRINITY_DN13316_c0_g1_i1:39-1883(+)
MADVRYADAQRVLGGTTLDAVKKAKVFVCGAGGIGCELLKGMVMTGFQNIEIIDMDTIDSSNLNRQFLFRPEHVNQPKSVVAKEAVLRWNPQADIVAHYANVKDAQFDVDFFKKFDIILNGLDNRSARSHVNRMAMKVGVPLVESGTMGFNGQVQPIVKDMTQCYDCHPKQAGQRSFAVCTIHQKPSSMVHCTHYAKEFYKRFFGQEGDQDPEMEFLSSFMNGGTAPAEAAKQIFDAICAKKISELLNIKKEGYSGAPPRPLTFADAMGLPEHQTSTRPAEGVKIASQLVLSVKDLAEKFVAAFVKLTERTEKVPWDKDDPLALALTVAVANLRAYNFNISLESEFEIKSISGNIIPAIATSNAVIAGGIVLEAVKLLTKQFDKVRVQSLRRFPARIKRKDCYIVPEVPPPVNPKCYVCQNQARQMHLELNLSATTVRFFVKNICEDELSLPHPMISLEKNGGDDEKLIYEDEEMTQNLPKTFGKFLDTSSAEGWSGWAILVEDLVQELTCEIAITHNPTLDPADYVLKGERPAAADPVAAASPSHADPTAAPQTDNNDDDDDVVVAYNPRKRTAEQAQGTAAAAVAAEDVLDVDDDDDEDEAAGPPAKRRRKN